jgi:hypothetical protein
MQFWKFRYVIGFALAIVWTIVIPTIAVLSPALHLVIQWGLITWPPPNTTFSTFFSEWRRRSPRPSTNNTQVRHAYSRATV